jgi:hypothetical protein
LTLHGCWCGTGHLKRGRRRGINFMSSAAQCPKQHCFVWRFQIFVRLSFWWK